MSDRKHQYEITTELTLREMIQGAFIMREREDELNEPKFLTYNHHRIDKLIGTNLVQGTWCSWLSRSLSMREGSGSIPDMSISMHMKSLFIL